jgi:hypothetical protein
MQDEDLETFELTVSGLSVGPTRVPSKRKRTEFGAFPCRSQKASMSFFNCVVRLILKNTSLLLSVTLIFRCSVARRSSGLPPLGLPLSEPDILRNRGVNLFLRAGCARLCDRLILVKAFQRYLKCVSLTFEATVCFKRALANPFSSGLKLCVEE